MKRSEFRKKYWKDTEEIKAKEEVEKVDEILSEEKEEKPKRKRKENGNDL